MRNRYFLFPPSVYFIYILLLPFHSYAKTGTNFSEEKVNGWLNKTYVGFIENKGQVTGLDKKPVKEVLFKTSIKNADIYITNSGITYVLKKQVKDTASTKPDPE